jgi:nickel transport protein
LALAAVAFLAAPAAAHKLFVFASAEGATIHGKAYFQGNTPARGLAVTAFDPQGAELARTTTDDQGEFTLTAEFRCDHRLVVETLDGHGAEFPLRAEQLPADLPPRDEAAGPPQTQGEHSHPHAGHSHVHVGDSDHHPSSGPSEELRALRADVAALQEQLTRYENRTRLRDLLGGIGYILGLAGIAFYFLGVRRKQAAEGADREASR